MSENEILDGIAGVAREHLGWTEPVRREMRLVEGLGLDSLKLLILTVEVENHFRIRLDGEAEAEIKTVGDLVCAIRRLRGE